MFRGEYDRQRTLAIRIAAITLASDSVITIARFRPSKAAWKKGPENRKNEAKLCPTLCRPLKHSMRAEKQIHRDFLSHWLSQ